MKVTADKTVFVTVSRSVCAVSGLLISTGADTMFLHVDVTLFSGTV